MPVLTLNFATPLSYAFSDSNKSIHPSNSRTFHFLKWSCCCQQEMRVSKCFGHRTSCLGPEVSQQSCQQYINCDWDFQEDLCSKWQGYSKMWWFKNFFGQEGTRRPQNVDQQTRRSVKLFCFFAVAVLWDFWNKTHIPHFFIPTHHHWVCLPSILKCMCRNFLWLPWDELLGNSFVIRFVYTGDSAQVTGTSKSWAETC